MSKQLDKIFDLVPREGEFVLKETTKELVPTNSQEDTTTDKHSEDVDNARKIHYDLINTTQEALSDLMEFVKDDPSARAFEVLANMIKTASDVTKTMTDLTVPKKGSEAAADKSTKIDKQQNIVFIGDTAKLQRKLKGLEPVEDEV